MGVALPPLTGLNDNTTSPHEAFLSLREAVRRDCHSDVALRKHITCHLVTLNDTGVHNLLQVLDCYLVDDMQMTMPEFLASRGALYGPVNRNKCEEVWNGDHIAYRCRTCGLSDSSCMCVRCFDPAQHENHDYRIYRCSYGGCCDCGDDLAWKSSGFCSRHKDESGDSPAVEIPTLEAARLHVTIDSILQFGNLVLHTVYEECTVVPSPSAHRRPHGFTHLLPVGGSGHRHPKRSSVPPSFASLSLSTQSLLARLSLSLLWLQSVAGSCMPYRTAVCRRFLEPISGLASLPDGSSDTLAFWLTFGVLLPLDCCDAVGVLYLKLLMDKSFKKAFSLRFLDAYAYYIQLYLGDTSSDSGRKHLSRHIDRLFCQLFHSSEQLRAIDAVPYRLGALHGLSMSSNARMTLSESLTYFCLREMANLLASAAAPTLRTNHVLIKTRVYARFCSELRCLLVHPDFAAQTIVNSWSENKMLENESIYQALLDILTTMQCMDTQVKQTGRHVDFESDAWQAAFVLDYEVLLVWQYLVQGLHHALETATMNKPLVLQMWLSPVADQLRRWWLAHGDCVASGLVNVQHQLDFYATRHGQLDRAVVATSMHLPLHHLFGSLLDEAHRYEPKDLLWTLVQREDRDFWFRLVVHLFQVHLFVRGIKCYEWVLNGQTMLHQVIHYHSRHWRYHGLHNDLFLLQLAAAALPPSAFTTLFLSQWLEHCSRAKDNDMRMTAEGLKVLLQVVLDPTKIAAVTPWDLLVRDVVHWLAIGPLTRTELHAKCDSRLIEMVKAGTFEEDEDIIGRVLAQVGDLATGSDMAETLPHMVLRGLEGGAGTGKSCTYVLKASAWALVCPLFESYSAMDVQKCDENAMLHDKTVVLQPVLQYLDAAFRSPGCNIHVVAATHVLACRNVLAVVAWILWDHPMDDGLVQVALYYLAIATTVLPRHQVTPPPYATTDARVNAIAAAFAGNTWWDHLHCDVFEGASVLTLLVALGPRFGGLANTIAQRIQSTTHVQLAARASTDPTGATTESRSAVPWTAKDRQAQILAKMKAQQQAFLIKQLEDDPDNLPLFDSKADDDAAEPDDSIPTSSPDIHADGEVCALCHGPHTSTDALEYMGCLTPSNMGTLTKPPYTLTTQCHLRLCGHVVHRRCIRAYLVTLHTTLHDERRLSRDHAEYLCPVCRRLCNTLVPAAGDAVAHSFGCDSPSSSSSNLSSESEGRLRVDEVAAEMEQRTMINNVQDERGESSLLSLAHQVDVCCRVQSARSSHDTLMELLLHTLFMTHLALPTCTDDGMSVDEFLRFHLDATSQVTLRHLVGLVRPVAVEPADAVAIVLHRMASANSLATKAAALTAALDEILQSSFGQDVVDGCMADTPLSSTLCQLGIVMYVLNQRRQSHVRRHDSVEAWLAYVGVPAVAASIAAAPTGDALANAATVSIHESTELRVSSPLGAQRIVWRDATTFSLVALPKLYVDIYLQYCQNTVRCTKCQQVPVHPALCLLCGTLVCCFGSCCADDTGVGECTRHTQTCGIGFGCFLLLHACTVLLLLGNGRCCIWGSVYLDRNGEEDAHFRRGKTLYLNQDRIAALTRLVVLHGFTENTAILNSTSRRDGARY
ncbi:hypothetical protein H310_07337 [Aphanomyces invadans]|uniref:E3 ubiquitin-protein ligase n=1 Tax=Aphanomyces invadans TaxID=157072 RepID=A0A024U3H0_9STRA|nr:hypothetical protein H310_07337 [Aphanomyces invadans]ETW00804.1 hypothetical protein H310_07337 [Aphanomyces invadans]|eukprot:XP_008870939.1 hypothetical protein H310_07337 [Aphanomyces invadans]